MAAMITSALSAISCCCDDEPVAESVPSCHTKKSDKPDAKYHHPQSGKAKPSNVNECKSDCNCVRVKSIQELPEFKSAVKKSVSSEETVNFGILEKNELAAFVTRQPEFEPDKIPKQNIAHTLSSPRAPPCL